ncbi:alpha-N-acetyl-neuraminyl-2,3-beta-galactosyl-1,3-N-acetyl-galactosaminide alpha-2,6-sialyltransferase-like isoform X2 [Apostichopus japonicus]|uniref:alpha-N-acetyl-neuraminyl-2,3-beta-galactosyl-1, 3-N-acetyl-galactosaminide alpha-2,6-sialyltransferase-like isoform X2 n=1 Tax=Stichopus japonicus TaxID=307972 RepID=UPI003AB73A7C
MTTCYISKKKPRRLLVFSFLQLFVFTTAYIILLNNYSDAVMKVADSLPSVILHSTGSERSAVKRSSANKPRIGHGTVFNGYRDIIFHKPLRVSCGSCAVVSSSGHLLGSRAGGDIDAHDCVIRMNNAPVRGYEKDVGTRTTIRSMANVNLARSFATRNHSRKEILVAKETRAEVILINWMNEHHVRRRKGREYQYALKLAGRHQDVHFFEFTPAKMMEAENLFQKETGITKDQANTWLSTGWFTMMASLDVCDRVTVFGMVPKNHCQKPSPSVIYIPYHYYDISGHSECQYYNLSESRLDGGHLFITEKAIFARWAERCDLTFRHPTWSDNEAGSGELDTPFLNRYREIQTKYNSSFTNVADYIKWRKAQLIPKRRMRLQMGNRIFDVDNKEALDTILNLLPEAKRVDKAKKAPVETHDESYSSSSNDVR